MDGKVAIVTGASAGLGWATVQAFASEGARVVANARRTERLQQLHDATGCSYVAGDASQEATAHECVQMAMERFGRIDILINNAGLGLYRSITETTLQQYDELMVANVRSGFVFARAVTPQMVAQHSGSIIFVSSVAGVQGSKDESVYAATKFAQVGMAQSLDAELRPHGIKVMAFCPGGMKTEFAIGQGREAEKVASSSMMDATDVAATLVHLCTLPANVRIPQSIIRHMA